MSCFQLQYEQYPYGDCDHRQLAFYDVYDFARCQREREINTTLYLCQCLAPYMTEAYHKQGTVYRGMKFKWQASNTYDE